MENPSDNSHSDHHDPHKRERKIVDDPVSSNPHSLLHWLKRQLHTFAPVNNPDYSPLLPAA